MQVLDTSSPAELGAALDRVLSSDPFVRSERMKAFLRFVVSETVEGRGSELKEQLIGHRVFGRDGSYDSGADPVVRVEARRLRSKLDEYYRGPGRDDPIRIELPKGSYAPVFSIAGGAPSRTAAPAQQRSLARFAFAVAVALAALALWAVPKLVWQARAPSVAVLPIQDLSADRTLGYFCDGLAEQLFYNLSRVEGLKVPGRTSSFRAHAEGGDIRAIGSRLAVGSVLEGSVRTDGRKLRINLELVSATNGYQLWTHAYERDFGDVLALEDEIATAVVNALEVRLAPNARAGPVRSFSRNSDAVRSYLEARRLHFDRDFQGAVHSARRAIALDPGFAAAWAQVARSTVRLAGAGADDNRDAARAAASRALEIDENLGEAYLARAIVNVYEWEWKQAESDFNKGLALNPGLAEAHGEYAIAYLAPAGRLTEALEHAARSVELDPLSVTDRNRYGLVLLFAGQVNRAIAELEETERLVKQSAAVRRTLGRAYLEAGNTDAALDHFDADPFWRAVTLARAGRRTESEELVRSLGLDPMERAQFEAASGHVREALAKLDEAIRQKHPLAPQIACDPQWRRLRGDPRFRELVDRIGLTRAARGRF